MTIKTLIYFDKLRTEYLEIINLLKNFKNIEIINFICSLNTPLSIDGLIQFNGTLINAIQTTKCDTVIIFSLTNASLEAITKLNSFPNHTFFILFPINVNVTTLEKISSFTNITLYTCLPLRHLLMVWKAYKRLTSTKFQHEPLQNIEAKFISPTLKQTNIVYGSPSETDINLNNYFQLIIIDVIQFLSQRNVLKIQAIGKSMTAEKNCNIKNDKYMHDYSVIIAHFKWTQYDKKKSPTSSIALTNLPPRTALIRIKSPPSVDGKIKFKIKIKSNIESITIDQDRLQIDSLVNSETIDCDLMNYTNSHESFLSSSVFHQGAERFIKHIDYARQNGAPRLIDVGTQNEEDSTVARTSLIGLSQFIQLCKVINTINKAISSCQTIIVE